jgi:hypothetical protein
VTDTNSAGLPRSLPQAAMLVAHFAGGVARLAVDVVSEVADAAAAVAFLTLLKRSVTFGALAHSNDLSSVFDQTFIGVRSGLHDRRCDIDVSQYVVQPTRCAPIRNLLDTLLIRVGQSMFDDEVKCVAPREACVNWRKVRSAVGRTYDSQIGQTLLSSLRGIAT